MIGCEDVTDSIDQLVFGLANDGVWCSFQLKVDFDRIELAFPHGTVNRHLGKPGAKLNVTHEDVKAMLDAGGYGTPFEDKIMDWLSELGALDA